MKVPALSRAVENNRAGVVGQLIQAKADVNRKDPTVMPRDLFYPSSSV